MNGYLLYFVNTFLLSIVCMQPLIHFAPKLGLLDLPHGRKQHARATPTVGGLAIFIAVATTVVQLTLQGLASAGTLFGLALLVALGIVDDRNGMAARIKLCGQAVAVLVLLLADGRLLGSLGDPLGSGPINMGVASLPVTLLFGLVLINAFNLIDGMDGLAGGIAVGALCWLAIAADMVQGRESLTLTLTVMAATLGFLIYNFRHPWRDMAAAFLGDAGSMLLGGVVALAVIQLAAPAADGTAGVPPVAALWIVALPVIDMVSVALRRMARGCSPFAADRRHLHHLLLDNGLSVQATVLLLILCNALLGAVGILGWRLGLPEQLSLLLLVVPVLLHTGFTLFGGHAVRIKRPVFGRAMPDSRTA